MQLYSKEFIRKVKNATNLLELVSEYTEVKRVNSKLWMARCPHPDHDDKTPSFRICLNPDDSWSWYCGGCHMGTKDTHAETDKNYGTDCFAFVSWMSDYKGSEHIISWRESVRMLAERASIGMPKDENEKTYRFNKVMAYKLYKDMLEDEEALGYLIDRGLSDEAFDIWTPGVSTSIEFGVKVKRISFPLIDRDGNIVGETARALNWSHESEFPKYKNSQNSKVFNKSSFLYGMNRFDASFKEIRITEGAMDVILADQFGVKNVVATLGTALTREHALIIKNLGVIPCFCMDGDEAGQKAIRKAVNMLGEEGVFSKVFILPSGKDLADLSLESGEETEEIISLNSMPYWRYELESPLREFDSRMAELRSSMLPHIIKAKNGISNPQDEILMKSFVRERFGISL